MQQEKQTKLVEQVMTLANELASTSTFELPVQISKLKDIMVLSIYNKCSEHICQVFWDCNVFNMLIGLMKNFSTFSDSWNTGIDISNIICKFVENFIVEDELVLKVYNQQLKCATAHIVFLIKSLIVNIDKESCMFKILLHDLFGNLKFILSKHPSLIIPIFKSENLFWLFTSENKEVCIEIVKLILEFLNTKSDYMKIKNDEKIEKYLFHIVYQLSLSTDIDTIRVIIELLLIWVITDADIIPVLRNKFDIVCILDKWYGKGFDENLMKIKRILKFSDATEKLNLQQKHELSARIIQRAYKKYQKDYKKKINTTDEKSNQKKRILYHQISYTKDIERKQQFRKLHAKYLDEIQMIPADQVNKYLEQKQNDAAATIQATWKGYKLRKTLKDINQNAKEHKAATLLQREIRKWLLKHQRKQYVENFDTLNWEEINYLQLLVEKWKKEHQIIKPSNLDEYNIKYAKSKEMLEDFYNCRVSRLYKQHNIDIMLAKLDADIALFSNLPSLQNVTIEDVNLFLTQNPSVISKAKFEHERELEKLACPQWKEIMNNCYEDIELHLFPELLPK